MRAGECSERDPTAREAPLLELALLLGLLTAASGCAAVARSGSPDACTPRPGEVFGATADSMLGGVVVSASPGITHTERQMQPDPSRRTDEHLHGLLYDLREFRRRHGRLPEAIDEFYDTSAPGIKYHIDGWGSSIRYTRLGPDSFELRAPGPDHTLCTGDDVVTTRDPADEIS